MPDSWFSEEKMHKNFIRDVYAMSFKSSEHFYEKGDGPYRGFVYSNLFSDPLDLATWSQRELL